MIKSTKTDATVCIIAITLLMSSLGILVLASGGQVKVWEATTSNTKVYSNGTEVYNSVNQLVPVNLVPASVKLVVLILFAALTLLIDYFIWVLFTRKRLRQTLGVTIDKPLSYEQIQNLTDRFNLKLKGDSDALLKELEESQQNR